MQCLAVLYVFNKKKSPKAKPFVGFALGSSLPPEVWICVPRASRRHGLWSELLLSSTSSWSTLPCTHTCTAAPRGLPGLQQSKGWRHPVAVMGWKWRRGHLHGFLKALGRALSSLHRTQMHHIFHWTPSLLLYILLIHLHLRAVCKSLWGQQRSKQWAEEH